MRARPSARPAATSPRRPAISSALAVEATASAPAQCCDMATAPSIADDDFRLWVSSRNGVAVTGRDGLLDGPGPRLELLEVGGHGLTHQLDVPQLVDQVVEPTRVEHGRAGRYRRRWRRWWGRRLDEGRERGPQRRCRPVSLTKPSIPASRQRCSSSAAADAVSASTGVCPVPSPARRVRVAARPSTRGMCTSIRTTSYRWRRSISRASLPSETVSQVRPSSPIIRPSSNAFTSSSSASRTRPPGEGIDGHRTRTGVAEQCPAQPGHRHRQRQHHRPIGGQVAGGGTRLVRRRQDHQPLVRPHRRPHP